MQLEDGTGFGYKTKVDNTNRAKTRSITEPGSSEAASNGDGYIITSGLVTLTSANESAVLWFQNEDEEPLFMDDILFVATASSGGGSNSCIIRTKVTPTGLGSGTGNPATSINSNFGSSKTLIMTSSEIGQEAATITGGETGPTFVFPDEDTTIYDAQVVLQKGTGVAITVEPPTGNTSQTVIISLRVHKLIGV